MGKDVGHVEYYSSQNMYALATNEPEDFILTDEEGTPRDPHEGPNPTQPTPTSLPKVLY